MTDPFPIPPEPALPSNPFRRWQLTEPVRLYLYAVAGVVVAGLLLFGVISGEFATFLTAALAVVLGVAPGAEIARKAVYPIASVERAALARVYAIRRRQQ